MPHDLEQQFHETAYQPTTPLDMDMVERRGDRRRSLSRAGAVATTVVLLAALSTGLSTDGPDSAPVISDVREPVIDDDPAIDDGVTHEGQRAGHTATAGRPGSAGLDPATQGPPPQVGDSTGEAPTTAAPNRPGVEPLALRWTFDDTDESWQDATAGWGASGPALVFCSNGYKDFREAWSWGSAQGAWQAHQLTGTTAGGPADCPWNAPDRSTLVSPDLDGELLAEVTEVTVRVRVVVGPNFDVEKVRAVGVRLSGPALIRELAVRWTTQELVSAPNGWLVSSVRLALRDGAESSSWNVDVNVEMPIVEPQPTTQGGRGEPLDLWIDELLLGGG